MNSAYYFRKYHKWLALIVGVQALLWAISGLYMTAVNIDIIHGDHLVKNQSFEPLSKQPVIPLNQDWLDSQGTIESIKLYQTASGPEYLVSSNTQTVRVNATSGQISHELSKKDITRLANFYYAGEASIESVNLLPTYPQELGGRNKPIWQVSYNDWLGSTLYFTADTGQLRSKRTDLWRWFDFLWMLHIMDYEHREEINNNLLRTAASLGLLMTLSGLFLLISRLKAGFRTGKSFRAKLQSWHKWVTLVIGLQVFIWMLSGLVFSILPQQKVSGWYLVKPPQAQIWNKGIDGFNAAINNHPDATAIETYQWRREEYLNITVNNKNSLVLLSTKSVVSIDEFTAKNIAVDRFKGQGKVKNLTLEKSRTTENRKFELPVWRVDFDGEENPSLYVSAKTGKLEGVKTDTWRLFDFFWMLHIMDYGERDDMNNGLVIFVAVIKLFVAISGVWLLFIVFGKRDFQFLRFNKRERAEIK